jgi:uncharacterized membrane protein (UPF0127 family)
MRYDLLLIAGRPLNVGIPETVEEAKRGLLGMTMLEDTKGLSYRPAPVLHTWGMKMEIDILWLDDDGNVLATDEDVPADQVIAPRTSWAVEVAGGWVRRNLT